MTAVEKALSVFNREKESYLRKLMELVTIPSVSFSGFDPQEVVRAAEKTAQLLKEHSFENVQILTLPQVHPAVYGERLVDPSKPTLLLYAHHDVQPAGDPTLWASPPFKPDLRSGRLYGRGTADDKGGIFIHVAAVHSWMQAIGTLPLNVKILVEGEEETGSQNLAAYLRQYRSLFDADALVLTDTSNLDVGIPSITTSLRGLVAVDVEIASQQSDLHSGFWGGFAQDCAMVLVKILSSLVDEEGRIAVPGLCDRVRPLTPKEKEDFSKIPLSVTALKQQAGLLDGVNPALLSSLLPESLWRQPSLSINAFQASSKKDARNIINGSAFARVGIRIVPDMDPVETQKTLMNYIRRQVPPGVKVKLTPISTSQWWTTSTTHPAFEVALKALEKGYGVPAHAIGCGASIPFVEPFARELGGVPALLIGVEDPLSNAHGENESLHVGDWYKAIASCIYLYEDLARVLKRN